MTPFTQRSSKRRFGAGVVLTILLGLAIPASGGVGLDSNLSTAFGHLNFNQGDMQHIYDSSWPVDDPTLFNFAASLDPPSIDPTSEPWGVPVRIGVTWATWSDAASFPSFPTEIGEVNGSLYLPHGGPQTGTEYALMWAQMGGQIPVTDPMDLFQNWSFPFAVPGEPTWVPNSAFPQDTWGNASIIPHVTYGPNPWNFGLSRVQPDGSLAPQDFEGFGLITGDTIILAVDKNSLLSNGTDGLTYGFAGHIHDGGFGANPQSRSLVSFATGTPGMLLDIPPATLLDIGKSPLPTTTTTTLATTTTTTQSESTSSTASVGQTEAGSDPGDAESGGIPLLGIILGLLGIVVVVIGGRMFFAAADDPCTELLKAWEEAQKSCDEAEAAAEKAKTDCDEATQEAADLEAEVNDLCRKWPPACEGEGASAEISGQPESRVTSRDLHARRIALGRLWDDYQAGNATAEDVQDAWERANTPEFREELRRQTDANIAKREKLESQIKDAQKDAHEKCEKAEEAGQEAEKACDEAAKAKKAYDECMESEAAEDFVDAFMGLGSDSGSGAQAAQEASQPAQVTTQQPQTAATAPPAEEPNPMAKLPLTFTIDRTGMTTDEASRARRLEGIFRNNKGTGDIAKVAEDLWHFNNWHTKTFGEPWLTWTTESGPGTVTDTARDSDTFMQTRQMACYEFVAFCGYIASDQLGRNRFDDDGNATGEFSIPWGFTTWISTNQQPLTGTAPRGSVITGSYRWGDYDNQGGYYHTGISIGDGKIISLGSDGLIREDATGALDACFPTVGYENIQYGDYKYGNLSPAPTNPTQ